jgi:hypothetical protein
MLSASLLCSETLSSDTRRRIITFVIRSPLLYRHWPRHSCHRVQHHVHSLTTRRFTFVCNTTSSVRWPHDGSRPCVIQPRPFVDHTTIHVRVWHHHVCSLTTRRFTFVRDTTTYVRRRRRSSRTCFRLTYGVITYVYTMNIPPTFLDPVKLTLEQWRSLISDQIVQHKNVNNRQHIFSQPDAVGRVLSFQPPYCFFAFTGFCCWFKKCRDQWREWEHGQCSAIQCKFGKIASRNFEENQQVSHYCLIVFFLDSVVFMFIVF